MIEFGEDSPRRPACRYGAANGLKNDSHHVWDLITSQTAPPCDLRVEGLPPAGQGLPPAGAEPFFPIGWGRVGPRRPCFVNDSTRVWRRLIGDLGEAASKPAPTEMWAPPVGSWTFGCPSTSDLSFGGGGYDAFRREWFHLDRRPSTADGGDGGSTLVLARVLPHNRSEQMRERLTFGRRRRQRGIAGEPSQRSRECLQDDGTVPQWEPNCNPGRGASALGSLRGCGGAPRRRASSMGGCRAALSRPVRRPSAWVPPNAPGVVGGRPASPFR